MVPKDDDVGVILPVYNRPKLVIKALESLAKQTVLPGRVIIIDDGSTDDTVKAVQGWIDNLKIVLNVSLITIEHQGPAVARNRGLQLLAGRQFIAMLDSDDLWPENYIERMTRQLNDNPQAVAVTCDRLYFYIKTGTERLSDLTTISDDPVAFMLKFGAGIVSNTMLRHKYILNAGAFNESLKTSEDAALLLRVALMGPWLYEPGEPVIINQCHYMGDEEENLSFKYANARMVSQSVYDVFIGSLSPNQPNRNEWEKIMRHKRWRLGLSCLKRGLFADAIFCFRRVMQGIIASVKQ